MATQENIVLVSSMNSDDINKHIKELKIDDVIYFKSIHDKKECLFVRAEKAILKFEYANRYKTFTFAWRHDVFRDDISHQVHKYPWIITDSISNNEFVIVLRTETGIEFFKENETKYGLTLLTKDGQFHDVYMRNDNEPTLLWGEIYPDKKSLGIMNRDVLGNVQFYSIRNDLVNERKRFPIWDLKKHLEVTKSEVWKNHLTKFYFVSKCYQDQGCIAVYSSAGLDFYRFNSKFDLVKLSSFPQMPLLDSIHNDKLYFTPLSNSLQNDLIRLNSTGIYVYSINNENFTINLLLNDETFSKRQGWQDNFSELKFFDINNDKNNDILYTGQNGVEVKTYNSKCNCLKTVMPYFNVPEDLRFLSISNPFKDSLNENVAIVLKDDYTEGNIQFGYIKTTFDIQNNTKVEIKAFNDDTFAKRKNETAIDLKVFSSMFCYDCKKLENDVPIARLADQLTSAIFNEALDLFKGLIKFSVPLFTLPYGEYKTVPITLDYNSEGKTNGIIGNQWKLSLSPEYIALSQTQNIFEESRIYFLSSLDDNYEFKRIKKENNIEYFEIEDQTEVKTIKYDANKQFWIVERDNEIITYGGENTTSSSYLRWSLGWKYWRGSGSDVKSLNPIPIAWYMRERNWKTPNQTLHYEYEVSTAELGKKTYTSEVRLKTIFDDKNFNLNLNYERKLTNETEISNPHDKFNNIYFPVELVSNSLLKSYKFSSEKFRQEIYFHYDIMESSRVLKEINQSIGKNLEQIFNCKYNYFNNDLYLEKITLSDGLSVEYGMSMSESKQNYKEKINYQVLEKPIIIHSTNYSIVYHVFDKKTFGVSVEVFDINYEHKVSERIFSTDGKFDKDSNMQAYIVQDLPVFVLFSQNNFYIYMIKDYNSLDFYQVKLNKDSIIAVNEMFVVFVDSAVSHNLKIFTWNNQSKQWYREKIMYIKDIKYINLYNETIVVHTNNKITIIYKDPEKKWTEKYFNSDFTGNVTAVLDNFKVSNEVANNLKLMLKNNFLTSYENYVALNFQEIKDDFLNSVLYIYETDEKHNSINVFKDIILKKENLLLLSDIVDYQESKYKLMYQKINGRYELKITEITGKLYNELPGNESAKKTNYANLIKEKNSEEGWIKLLEGHVIFNTCTVQFNKGGIFCDSENFIQHTGSKFQVVALPEIQSKLGDHFILETPKVGSGNNNYTLFHLEGKDDNKKSPIKTFEVEKNTYILNKFPLYIAYQYSPSNINVITFENSSKISSEPKIHNESNETLLFTSTFDNIYSYSETLHQLYIRPVRYLTPKSKKRFVNKMSSNSGDENRYMSYYRTDSESQGELSVEIIIVPENNRTMYGWNKKEWILDRKNNTMKTIETEYSIEGSIVLKEEIKDKDEQKEETKSENTILLDCSSNLIISDISPNSLVEESFAYIGFEDYEICDDLHSRKKLPINQWVFKKEYIKKSDALTGENVLGIFDSSSLVLKVNPADQFNSYIASCWLRNINISRMDNDDISTHFHVKVKLLNNFELLDLASTVEKSYNDWVYVYVSVDFFQIKNAYRSYLTYSLDDYDKISEKDIENTKFMLEILIEPSKFSKIEVDHVIFTPSDKDINIFVYDSYFYKPTVIIRKFGYFERNYHNLVGNDLSTVNIDNEVEEFYLYNSNNALVKNFNANIKNTAHSILTIQPESGFIENFNKFSIYKNWIVKDMKSWIFSRNECKHVTQGTDSLELNPYIVNTESSAIYFTYILSTSSSMISLHWKGYLIKLFCSSNETYITLETKPQNKMGPFPNSGTVLLAIHDFRLYLWVNGLLHFDAVENISKDVNSSMIEMANLALIREMFILNKPIIKVKYLNSWGETVQSIVNESKMSALITSKFYDHIGRETVTTKTTEIFRKDTQSLLSYVDQFAYFGQKSMNMVLKGQILGEINGINPNDDGYPYFQTTFRSPKGDEKKFIGLPGRHYSTKGKFGKESIYFPKSNFPAVGFPEKHGYYYKVVTVEGLSEKISIFDINKNQVATYISLFGCKSVLSTIEYNSENKPIMMLPPTYHAIQKTIESNTTWSEKVSKIKSDGIEKAMGTHILYNEKGDIAKKITPDAGNAEYLYDQDGKTRFTTHSSAGGTDNETVSYAYNKYGFLQSASYFKNPISQGNLTLLIDSDSTENLVPYQEMFYERNETLSEYTNSFITYNDEETIIEKVTYNINDKITNYKVIVSPDDSEMKYFNPDIKREYQNNLLSRLKYPSKYLGKDIIVSYEYNNHGKMIQISLEQFSDVISIKYQPSGELSEEFFSLGPNNAHFTRSYSYNSPGFLTQISDKFLSETITYEGNGYIRDGLGDGIIMSIIFNAMWHRNADKRQFVIKQNILGDEKLSQTCINAFINLGYLSKSKIPMKPIDFKENNIPALCGGYAEVILKKEIAKKSLELIYGYKFSYGNLQQLLKAKYFTKATEIHIDPLRPSSFEILCTQNKEETSLIIWRILLKLGYIISDNIFEGETLAIGKEGKSFIRDKDLKNILLNLSNNNHNVKLEGLFSPIKKYIILKVINKEEIKWPELKMAYFSWINRKIFASKEEDVIKELHERLIKDGFTTTPFESDFVSAFKNLDISISDLARVLFVKFSYALGESPNDVESYDIDLNGNHRTFYTGFRRLEIKYINFTNKIESVIAYDPTENILNEKYQFKHDARGNVIKAPHLGIKNICYHPVSQRTIKIEMENGTYLTFSYDGRGERMFKRVYDANNNLVLKVFYIRNELGQVLYDQRISYDDEEEVIEILETSYIYGPRGLVAFIRNDQLYAVHTDHTGSIKLVIGNGSVLHAYDYLPYGELIKHYGYDNKSHIHYLYTGKEFDAETGLYNFHARLFDPIIGRFYQIDPREQYFSPYKYAGNSPISLSDADGEYAILIAIMAIFAVGGAYLGAAAVNKNWNPLEWDYKDYNTYLGALGGGIAGALLPLAFVEMGASGLVFVGFLKFSIYSGVGIGFAYVYTAGENENWNPSKWDWTQPGTYNALFDGFGTGAGFIKVLKAPFNIKATPKLKALFITVSYVGGGVTMYVIASSKNDSYAFWEWNWKDPSTYSTLIDGFNLGYGWPQGILEVGQGFKKIFKSFKNVRGKFHSLNPKIINKVTKIMRGTNNVLKHVVFPSLMVATSALEFGADAFSYDIKHISSFEIILNGLYSAKDIGRKKWKRMRSKIKKSAMNLSNNVRAVNVNIKSKLSNFYSKRIIRKSFSHPEKFKFMSKDLKTSFKKFSESGKSNWISGKNEPSPALKKYFNRRAEIITSKNLKSVLRFENELSLESSKSSNLKVVSNPSFLTCSGSRLVKRGLQKKNICGTPIPSKKANNLIKSEPKKFLESNGFSTKKIEQFSKKNGVALKNGEAYNFILVKMSEDSDTYHLSAGNIGDKRNTLGVCGYWLNTKDKITVPAEGFKYVFTAELQGCSLYAKYHRDTDKMEFFHYNRPEPSQVIYINNDPEHSTLSLDSKNKYVNNYGTDFLELDHVTDIFDKNGNQIVPKNGAIIVNEPIFAKKGENLVPIETLGNKNIKDVIKTNVEIAKTEKEYLTYYDNVLSYEDYLGESNYAIKYLLQVERPTYATPLIYRDDAGTWHIATKKISYDFPEYANPKFLDSSYVENFKVSESEAVDICSTPSCRTRGPRSIKKLTPQHFNSSKSMAQRNNKNKTPIRINQNTFNVVSSSSKLLSPINSLAINIYDNFHYIFNKIVDLPEIDKITVSNAEPNIVTNNKYFKNENELPDTPNLVPIQQIDMHGSLLLADVCMRKITKAEPLRNSSFREINSLDIQACALNLVTMMEEIIESLILDFNLNIDDVGFDPISLQSLLSRKLGNIEKKQLAKILYSSFQLKNSITKKSNIIKILHTKIDELLYDH